ncbi:hypothetical protein SEPCBS119000_001841 [Sporothrix epigloea]|uniref:Uncharacterized protein n=1 Tax=Sporothrix epigloea TaxID=1892477 RepID=A0ABP0DFJ0_9PEZI
MDKRPPRVSQAPTASKPRSSHHKDISTDTDTDTDTDSDSLDDSISSSSPSPPAPPRAFTQPRPRHRTRARPLSETLAIPRPPPASAHPPISPSLGDTPLALPPPPIGSAFAERSSSTSPSPLPNGRHSKPRPTSDAHTSPISPPLSDAQEALPSRTSRRQRRQVDIPPQSETVPRSSQLSPIDDQSAVVVQQSSRRPRNRPEFDENYGQDRREGHYQRDHREHRDYRDYRGQEDYRDYRGGTDDDLGGLSTSAWKAPLLFVGSVAAATFCIDRFWPRGITYGEKEAWEVREEEIYRHHGRSGRQATERRVEAARALPDGSRRMLERERTDDRLGERRLRDSRRIPERAQEWADDYQPRGHNRRREKALVVDRQESGQRGQQYIQQRQDVQRSPSDEAAGLQRPAAAADTGRPPRLLQDSALRENAGNPLYLRDSRDSRNTQDDAFEGDESFRRLRERRARAQGGRSGQSTWDAPIVQDDLEDNPTRRRHQNGDSGSILKRDMRNPQVDRRARAPRDLGGEDDFRRSLYSHAHGNGRFLLDPSTAAAGARLSAMDGPRYESTVPDRYYETKSRLQDDPAQRQRLSRQQRDHADANGGAKYARSSRRVDGPSAATAATTAALAAGATIAALNGRQSRRERGGWRQVDDYGDDSSFDSPPRPNQISKVLTADGPRRPSKPVSYTQSAYDDAALKDSMGGRASYGKPLYDYDSESDASPSLSRAQGRDTSRRSRRPPVNDYSDDDDLIEVMEDDAPARRTFRQNKSLRVSPQPPLPLITRTSPPSAGSRRPAPLTLSASDTDDDSSISRRHTKTSEGTSTLTSPRPFSVASDVHTDISTDDDDRTRQVKKKLSYPDSFAYSGAEAPTKSSFSNLSDESHNVYSKTHRRRGDRDYSVYMSGGAGPGPSDYSQNSDSHDSDSETRHSRSFRRASSDSGTSELGRSPDRNSRKDIRGKSSQHSDWDHDGALSTQRTRSLDSLGSGSRGRSSPYIAPSPPSKAGKDGGKREPSADSSSLRVRSPIPPHRGTRAAAVGAASYLSEDLSRPSDTSSLRNRYQSGEASRGPASSLMSASLRPGSLRSSRLRHHSSLHSRESLHSNSSSADDSASGDGSTHDHSHDPTPPHLNRSPQPPRSSTSTTSLSKGESDSEKDSQLSQGSGAGHSSGYAGPSEVSGHSRRGTSTPQEHDYLSYKSYRHRRRTSSDNESESSKSSGSASKTRSRRTGSTVSVSANDKRLRASDLERASDSDSDKNTIRHSSTSSLASPSLDALVKTRRRAR